MHILSLHLGHNATVSLYHNDRFLEVVSQEKFDNIKNSASFPSEAIKYLLEKYTLKPTDIDHIVNASTYVFPGQMYDYLQTQTRGKNSFLKKTYYYLRYRFGNCAVFDWIDRYRLNKFSTIGAQQFQQKLNALGFTQPIHYVDHHTCHAYSPVAVRGDSDEKFLIFTMDGSGDGLSATVSIYDQGKVERIAETSQKHSVGGVYSNTTKFLGMKILEHEYKVMGLAAYAKESYFQDTYNKVFKNLIWLESDGLTFNSRFPMSYVENHFKNHAVGERFDNIAGALQYFTETLILQWIRNAVQQTGINNIMTSGGVFMNVKLNQKILALPEVEKAFFMPSCGDESNVFGATAYFVKNTLKQNLDKNLSIYLGMTYSNQEIEEYIRQNDLEKKYQVSYIADIETRIAELLSEFQVVARVSGRTEFGARSLGNRALLANPSDMKSFYLVNDQIKSRDFWMPFAPSMLDTYAHRYLKNYDPDKYTPDYMICTYESTLEFQENCRAAMHQGDHTARPQIVTAESNPKYYKIISEFEKRTGIGAVLNTSFNLHGYPLVGTPEQAIFTFENSGLEYLALENWLISKK